MRHVLWLSLVLLPLLACNGQGDLPVDSGPSSPEVTASLGPIHTLTEPGAGALQTHATAAWGGEDRYLVAFAIGLEPETTAVTKLFSADHEPLTEASALYAGLGAKPDVEWNGSYYAVAFTGAGRVQLAALDAGGAIAVVPHSVYEIGWSTDVADLALGPDGGEVVWTEYGAPGMTEADGRVVYRSFDASLAGVGPPHEIDYSSRKTADAARTPDGGWAVVFTRDFDHPSVPGDFVYEVWGRLYRGDGTAWTWRADDLDTAYPSRPALAVSDDGLLAATWRDKTESEGAGQGSGAYVRLFDPSGAPLGPSIPLGEGFDGDRVVVDFAGDLAVCAWQETDPDGLPGLVMSVVHAPTQQIVVSRLALHEPGGDRDERPSIDVREVGGAYEVLVVWETLDATGRLGRGLRARTVQLQLPLGPGSYARRVR